MATKRRLSQLNTFILTIKVAEKFLREVTMTTAEAAEARRLARRILKLAQEQKRRRSRATPSKQEVTQ